MVKAIARAAAIWCVCATVAQAALHEMFLREERVGAAVPQAAPQRGAALRKRNGRAPQRSALPVPQDKAVYPFFADTAFTTTVTRVSRGFGGAEIVEGRMPARNLTSLSIYTPQGVRHEVHATENGRVYIAVTLPDGTMEMQEHDPSREPCRCATCEHHVKDAPALMMLPEEVLTAKALGDTEVDVMLVFDTLAVTWANASAGGVTNFALSAVSRMNTALTSSGIACTMRLVGVYCPSYTYGGNFNTSLDELTKGLGGLSGVAAQRNACGADVVSMMVDTGSAYGVTGLGWVNASVNYAFSVCAVRSVNQSHTMSHEIGHNFGCDHSKYQTSSPGPNSYYSYATGWYFTGNNNFKYHTIMAYGDDGHGNSYLPCGLYSSPLVTYQGVAAGHAADGDNARCIRERKATLAGFKTPPNQLPPPTGVTASIGTYSNKIRIAWSSVSNATSYAIYRNASDHPSTATPLAAVSASPYDDTAVSAGASYYYWVVASNSVSGASAPSASARGATPLPITLGAAVNAPALAWASGGSLPWFAQNFYTHDNSHAAQSGPITHNQSSWIETTVTGPGTLTFWWKISSEANWDWLRCYTNTSVKVFETSGETNWVQKTITVLSQGPTVIRWTYSKDSNTSVGSDCGWLDEVVWTPAQTQFTPRPVPHTWLDAMYPGNGGNYEALALGPGLNGYPVWESYVAGLAPTNASSKFLITNLTVNASGVTLGWDPHRNDRAYKVLGKTNMVPGEMWHYPTNSGTRFFKVNVDLPGY